MKRLFLIGLLLWSVLVSAQEEAGVKKLSLPEGYEAKLDVVYTTVGNWKGREDVYFNAKAEKPTPVVFNIHGGGWNHGTKESQSGFGSFFKMGFAVVNIEYRLSGVAAAPAAVEDVRSAILYVVLHAKEYHINPQQIVVMGSSAGAHLALMAGLLQNDNRFDADFKDVTNFRIAAIIDKYSPTDLTVAGIEKNKSAAAWLGSYLGNQEKMASVSPIYYVKKTSPPIFIVHGNADPTVPYAQSTALKKKLDEAGVINEMITVEDGGHGNFTKEKKDEVSAAIIQFIKKQLQL